MRFGKLNSIGRRGKKTRNRPVIPAVDPRGKTEKQNHSYRSPIDGDRRFPPSILPDLSRGRRSIADNFFIILGHTASPRRGCHHSLLTKCGTKKSLPVQESKPFLTRTINKNCFILRSCFIPSLKLAWSPWRKTKPSIPLFSAEQLVTRSSFHFTT